LGLILNGKQNRPVHKIYLDNFHHSLNPEKFFSNFLIPKGRLVLNLWFQFLLHTASAILKVTQGLTERSTVAAGNKRPMENLPINKILVADKGINPYSKWHKNKELHPLTY
jgi:hypothetical protein